MNFAPVSHEPGSLNVWMSRPMTILGCPPGLEYLAQIDKIKIEQLVSLVEAFTGFERNNKYVLRNANNEQFFYVFEGKLMDLLK